MRTLKALLLFLLFQCPTHCLLWTRGKAQLPRQKKEGLRDQRGTSGSGRVKKDFCKAQAAFPRAEELVLTLQQRQSGLWCREVRLPYLAETVNWVLLQLGAAPAGQESPGPELRVEGENRFCIFENKMLGVYRILDVEKSSWLIKPQEANGGSSLSEQNARNTQSASKNNLFLCCKKCPIVSPLIKRGQSIIFPVNISLLAEVRAQRVHLDRPAAKPHIIDMTFRIMSSSDNFISPQI